MLRGEIDRLTSAGLFEGWAVDEEAPLRPLAVAIVDGSGREIAAGHAHLYEPGTRRGSDWAAFRLRAGLAVVRLRGGLFSLRAPERGAVIAGPSRTPWVERIEPGLDSLEAVAACDPTVTGDLAALEGCAGVLVACVAARGVESFVRTAHLYVLGRPIDAKAFVAFRNALAGGVITPLGMLRALAGSAEFQRDPRPLAAPNSDGFPFASR